MLVCETFQLEPWRPDFSSSDQPSPHWTRLICQDHELSNSVESIDPADPPVQVWLCEECGFTHCASGGYIHASRLGELVLWTPLREDPDEDWSPDDRTLHATMAAVSIHGAVVFPRAAWDDLRQRFANLPSRADLPATARRDLVSAWHAGAGYTALSASAIDRATDLALLDASAAGGDVTAAHVAALARWFAAAPDAPVKGELAELDAIGARWEALVLDDGSVWEACALVDGEPAPVFDARYVLV